MKDGKVIRRFNPPKQLPKPAQPQQPAIPLVLNIVFKDGEKPVSTVTLNGMAAIPPQGQATVLEIGFDARALFAELEAKLGPQKQGVQLWQPGKGV